MFELYPQDTQTAILQIAILLLVSAVIGFLVALFWSKNKFQKELDHYVKDVEDANKLKINWDEKINNNHV